MAYPARRREDRTKVGKLNHVLDEYKIFVHVVYFLLAFVGAKIVWPGERIEIVARKQAAHEQFVSDHFQVYDSVNREQNFYLRTLVRLRCLDKTLDLDQAKVAGICESIQRAVERDSSAVLPGNNALDDGKPLRK